MNVQDTVISHTVTFPAAILHAAIHNMDTKRLLRCAYLATIHHINAIQKIARMRQTRFGQHNGYSFCPESCNDVRQAPRQNRRYTLKRFIKQQQPGPAHQGARHCHKFLLSAGKRKK